MKKISLVSLAAAALMAAAFCSCKKDTPVDAFDHFKIDYKIETNIDSRDCFSSDYEILINGKVDDSGAVTMTLDGEYTKSPVSPDCTITFRTVPCFKDPIPASVDLYLKYDITFSAIGKEGEVLNSESFLGTRSSDRPIILATDNDKRIALQDYTIDFSIKSSVSNGRIEFAPAN